MRVNKFFTANGICSRRQADQYIEEGRVKINDRVAVHGDKLVDGDVVFLDSEEVVSKKKNAWLALYHKPVGVESTMDKRDEKAIPHFVNIDEYFFNIGRLDQNSEGLLLLTNEGDWVNQILRSKYNHEKEYHVKLNQPLKEKHLLKWRSGVEIGDSERGKTLPCEVELLEGNWIKIIMTEGRNRQIRRVAQALGYYVKRLKRVRVGSIVLGDLPKGEFRFASAGELNQFKSALSQVD